MTNCIFCRIINKEIPAKIIHEDDFVVAFNDISPQAPVHVLIIPKKHIVSLSELKPEDNELVSKIYSVIKKVAANTKINSSGYRVVVNNGPDAGQAVDHLHFHILGGRKLSWPPG